MGSPTLAYKILNNKIIKKISIILLKLIISFFNFIPEKLAFKLATFLGIIFYLLGYNTRRATINSIKVVFPNKSNFEIHKIALLAFINQSKNLIELMRYPSLKKSDIKRKVKFVGLKHLNDALSRGSGVILLVAHIGNWEFLGATWGMLGYNVYSFFLDARIDEIGNLLNNLRKMCKIKLISRSELKKSISCLKENALLGVIADQDGGKNGVYTKFFGKIVSAPRGPAALAYTTNAIILPNFLIRNKDNTYTMIIQKPIILEKTKNKEADIKKYTDLFLSIYEKIILQYPEQWLWMYDRFKDRRHVVEYIQKNNLKN